MKAEMLRSMVRPGVTIMFTVTVCAAFLVGKLSADQFIPLAAGVILSWFGSRAPSK